MESFFSCLGVNCFPKEVLLILSIKGLEKVKRGILKSFWGTLILSLQACPPSKHCSADGGWPPTFHWKCYDRHAAYQWE